MNLQKILEMRVWIETITLSTPLWNFIKHMLIIILSRFNPSTSNSAESKLVPLLTLIFHFPGIGFEGILN